MTIKKWTIRNWMREKEWRKSPAVWGWACILPRLMLSASTRWPQLSLYCIPCQHHWQQEALRDQQITLPFLQQEREPRGGRLERGQKGWGAVHWWAAASRWEYWCWFKATTAGGTGKCAAWGFSDSDLYWSSYGLEMIGACWSIFFTFHSVWIFSVHLVLFFVHLMLWN